MDKNEKNRMTSFSPAELQLHLAHVVNHSMDGILTISPDGKILTWNAGAKDMYGYAESEAVGQPIQFLVPPDKQEEMGAILKLVHRGEHIQGKELVRKKKSGELINVSVSIAPLRDAEQIIAVAEIGRDITGRKQWEKTVQENETRFRRLANSSPVLIWMSDVKGRCIFVNQALLDFMGCSRDDPRLEDLYFGVHPRDLTVCANALQMAFDTRSPFQIDYQLLRYDGHYRWLQDHGVPYFNDQNQFAGFIGSCVDITDLKRTHDDLDKLIKERTTELQEAHGGIQAVLDGAPLVLFMGDTWGKITHITGRGIEGMKETQKLFIEKHKMHCPAELEYKQALAGRDASAIIQLDTGHVFEIFYSPRLDKDGAIIGVVGVATDITQRFQAEEKRRSLETLCTEIASAENLDQAVLCIVEKICNMAIWNYGEAWLPDDTGKYLACSSAHWCSDEDRKRVEEFRKASALLRYRRGEGVPGRAWESKAAYWTKDITSDIPKRSELATAAGFHSAVAIPVIDHEEVMAVLVFFLTKPADMDQGLYGWIQSASAQLALFLRRRIAEDVSRRYLVRLRSLAEELERGEGQERRRIAKGLHDGVGQNLTLANIKMEELKDKVPSNLRKTIETIKGLIDKSNSEIRSLTFELSPPILYELGFESAVTWLGEKIQKDHGISFHIKCDSNAESLDESLRTTLFEAVREILHNVVKHAHAAQVDIIIERPNENIRVEIADDGKGFDMALSNQGNMAKGFGLFNIKERMEYNGGRFSIDSMPGKGTVVILEVPLSVKARDVSRKETPPRNMK